MKQAYVIAHYDPNGQVRMDLVQMVELLSRQAERVIFVSTCLGGEEAELLGRYAIVIRRENFGYDFWSYKLGLEALGDPRNYNLITFFNSSFFIADSDRLLRNAMGPIDVPTLRGVTIYSRPHIHVQSYWLSFGGGVCQAPYFYDWWSAMTPLSVKSEVIAKYELGLSAYMHRQGVRLEAIFKPTLADRILAVSRAYATRKWRLQGDEAAAAFNIGKWELLNPTHYMYDGVFNAAGVIKNELLDRNPHDIPIKQFVGESKINPVNWVA